MRCLPLLTISAFLLAIINPSRLCAHNVGMDCKVRDDKIEVEAFYDDNKPAAKARVYVRNIKEEVVASGLTDENGKWSFVAPAPGNYAVHLDAGAGHRAKADLVVPARTEETRSNRPTRAEFTSIPWLKIAIGLIVIGGLSGAFLIAQRLRKAGK